MSLLTKLEMDQAEEPQEGRRGTGLEEDGNRAGVFSVRGFLSRCLDYSISFKNVEERGLLFFFFNLNVIFCEMKN